MQRLAFLASNNGSGMRAVLAAIKNGDLPARAVLAASNRKAAPALEFARAHGVACLVIPTLTDPDGADARLAAALREAKADLVILSGYLRKLGPRTLAAYDGRILNIHPALLPRHGGAGGLHGVRSRTGDRRSASHRAVHMTLIGGCRMFGATASRTL